MFSQFSEPFLLEEVVDYKGLDHQDYITNQLIVGIDFIKEHVLTTLALSYLRGKKTSVY